MLDSTPTLPLRAEVFRLAAYLEDETFMQELEFDERSIDELKELLESVGAADSLEKLCDDPFKPKSQLHKSVYGPSRFSDGSFPVFYSALDTETAKTEAWHWFSKFGGKRKARLYRLFTCHFGGSVKDLRPKQAKWPALMHDSDYGFCNNLGAEAVKRKLDGLLVPSVRREGGTNVPVFSRSAISNPIHLEYVPITWDVSEKGQSLATMQTASTNTLGRTDDTPELR